MVTPAVTPTVTLSTTPMVDSAVEVPLPPARGQGMPRQGMPCHCASGTKTFQPWRGLLPVHLLSPPHGRLLTALLTYCLRGCAERDEKRGRGRSAYLGCASCFLSRPDHLDRSREDREEQRAHVGTPGGCDSIHIFHRPTALRRHAGLYCTVIPASGRLAAFLPVLRAAAGRVNSTQQPIRVRPTPTARRTTSSGVGAYETRGGLLHAHALTHAQAHRPSCRLTPNLGLSPAA